MPVDDDPAGGGQNDPTRLDEFVIECFFEPEQGLRLDPDNLPPPVEQHFIIYLAGIRKSTLTLASP